MNNSKNLKMFLKKIFKKILQKKTTKSLSIKIHAKNFKIGTHSEKLHQI